MGFGKLIGNFKPIKVPGGSVGDDAAGIGSGAGRYADKVDPQNINIKVDAAPPARPQSTARKAAKNAAKLAVVAGLGGLYFYLKDEENDEKRKVCKKKCVPVNWDDFIGYEDSLWKSCAEFGDDEKEEKGCKPNSLKDDDGKEVGHQLGEDYCKEEYGDDWEENCKYYNSGKIARGELMWQPHPPREPEEGQPYCTPELDNPLEETCPQYCEEACNDAHPKTNPFDPSSWWNALKDTWPFSELPDNLPWTTIILVIMAVILVPIVLSLVK
jgi:hypothetical protein